MDFRRIEWIFLVAFIALDIFLGWSMTQSQRVYLTATATNESSQTAADIKHDSITLPKLSDKTSDASYVAGQNNSALSQNYSKLSKTNLRLSLSTDVNQVLQARLTTPLQLGKKNVVKQLEAYVHSSGNVLFGSRYSYMKDLGSDTRYVFVEKVNGHTMIDDRAMLTLTVKDNALTAYQQTYIDRVQTMDNEQTIMSARDAVYTLYRANEIVDNSRVLWVRKGYTWLLTAKGSQVYTPAWFIGVESKSSKSVSIKRVNAVTQTVMKAH